MTNCFASNSSDGGRENCLLSSLHVGPGVAPRARVVHDVGHWARVLHAGEARHRTARHGRDLPHPRCVPEHYPRFLVDGRLGHHGIKVIGDRMSVVGGAGRAGTEANAHHRASRGRGVTIQM